ncbi:MAG: DUF1800 domain-containing protein [Gammaproteobacteria bacterium]|nr:DUF1800 domain-containing protein [Gammaproteobacteria bacterium]MBT8106450.1 DUF1800 domain-containing protein [Gammaproteobacteria bacterium]NNK26465.1 DUF1800 domain-containing protein [Woeseiaceae bacterium]NNL62621.1 DUF1800 domain-containing protein [Woeseiaceae bacterium]
MNASKIVIAVNRFGLGARPGELDRVQRPAAWLLDQLQGPAREPAVFRDLPDSARVLTEARDLRREQREAKRNDEDVVRKYGRWARRNYVAQTAARYRHAVETDGPFHDRLVHFWSNHFAVSADKQPLPAIAGLMENEAIRPHVGGRFADLLLAVEKHAAMIIYLDNQRSIGPNSPLGKRAGRRRPDQQVGLNENLAREILELHTLGVDGGYTQRDVTTFAQVITGWSIGGAGDRGRFADGEPGRFEFREAIHEPGARQLLGRRYAQAGVAQGEAVLRDLATHASTARFVSTKLARHFVADDPPPGLVDEMARAWLESGGDLPTVYEAMLTSDEAWDDGQRKYKSPHDFVVSTLRAFNHVPERPQFIVGALDLLGQTPFRPGSPAGWPDTAEQWGGADALYKRIEFSNQAARLIGSGVDPVELGAAVLGTRFDPDTRRAISRAESRIQGMTLLLASPDFQRR